MNERERVRDEESQRERENNVFFFFRDYVAFFCERKKMGAPLKKKKERGKISFVLVLFFSISILS